MIRAGFEFVLEIAHRGPFVAVLEDTMRTLAHIGVPGAGNGFLLRQLLNSLEELATFRGSQYRTILSALQPPWRS